MRTLFHLTLTLLLFGVESHIQAQSHSRPSRPSGIQLGNGSATRQPSAGSASKPQMTVGSAMIDSMANGANTRNAGPTLAMRGRCPVCIVEMKKWVEGVPAHQVVFDGKIYQFPEEKQRQMFLKNPEKYVPALRGDCIVCYAKSGNRMEGNLNHGSLYRGRVYLFPSEEMRAEFRNNPAAFANADLALGGMCAVCRVEMNKNMRGVDEFTAIHNGLRYLFPGKQQRDMFLADPAKYATE